MRQSTLFFILVLGVSLTSCKKASGDKAQVAEKAKVEVATGTSMTVNIANSKVLWEGAKPTGSHKGIISLSSGEIVVSDGTVTGGNFILDMNSISVVDLDGEMKSDLEGHLKGAVAGKEDHFFNVAKYPTGKFVITKTTILANDPDATHLVYGNLTLRDVTKEIGFKAHLSIANDVVKVMTPSFTINRTNWGVNYGSKSVFDNLGDKFVNDDIGLSIELIADKVAM